MAKKIGLLPLRPPAVPLVTHDPYFSVWSCTDKLTEDWTKHWTGAGHGMCGLIRVDGQAYRFAGGLAAAPPMEQLELAVQPTRTVYRLAAGGVELTLTFLTPCLCDDLDLLSRPITYALFDVRSRDGKTHQVSLYYDVGCDWAVDTASAKVDAARLQLGDLVALRAGASEQRMLARSGDNLRTEWGYLYLAGSAQHWRQAVTFADARTEFATQGKIPDADAIVVQHPAGQDWPGLSFASDLGAVTGASQRRVLLLGFDDIFSIEHHQRKLRPYWRRHDATIGQLLQTAAAQLPRLEKRCAAFDAELIADLTKAGGPKYATLCSLAYRQAIQAHKLVADAAGGPLFFSKENFSNGCIATVDVTYPSAPLFLLLQPKLLEGMLTPILDYALTPQWRFAFAPHDLGQYPLANGQVYGGGEKSARDQMPVEECGNLLILVGALAKVEGNADYAGKYWGLLTRWAKYLKGKGMDPEEQLCTDDFAGHLGHNTNLSLKAIVALAVYALLAEMLGHKEVAAEYRRAAEGMAKKWQKMAADGDHYRLAFDRPGSWSQKYNLVWDKLLGLKLFPPEVAQTEIAYYKKVQSPLGLPLDNRKTYTKIDWIVWTATLADNAADFQALVDPLYTWLNETPTRVPMTDWYETADGKQVAFQARSVVGGLFIKLLEDRKTWAKWARRAK